MGRELKTYEQERDEAAAKIDDSYDWIQGADWANARAEKVIEDLNHRNGELGKMGLELADQVNSRDAMIEELGGKLNRALDYLAHLHGRNENRITFRYDTGSAIRYDEETYSKTKIYMERLIKDVAELKKWKKTK